MHQSVRGNVELFSVSNFIAVSRHHCVLIVPQLGVVGCDNFQQKTEKMKRFYVFLWYFHVHVFHLLYFDVENCSQNENDEIISKPFFRTEMNTTNVCHYGGLSTEKENYLSSASLYFRYLKL